jgi:hypothetical protein
MVVYKYHHSDNIQHILIIIIARKPNYLFPITRKALPAGVVVVVVDGPVYGVVVVDGPVYGVVGVVVVDGPVYGVVGAGVGLVPLNIAHCGVNVISSNAMIPSRLAPVFTPITIYLNKGINYAKEKTLFFCYLLLWFVLK